MKVSHIMMMRDINTLILEFDDQLPIIKSNKVSCNNCENTHFINDKGYRYCNKCGHSIGHILSYNDLSKIDRRHFHQKSIYKRKYHYQNKIEGSSIDNTPSGFKFPVLPPTKPLSFSCDIFSQ